ncbi:MAG: response regulator [Desulfovibrio sp.]|jgi:DNA-binding response OmpR family regulator|nr:response regulator [Desulfovibrio sp.]
MRALFVDDETEFLELMEKRLARRNISIATAPDGKTALKMLDEALNSSGEMFQVVVLDVRMPGMDGLETLQRIKEKASSLPVLLLTGHACMGAAVQGMDIGAYDYMLKPVSISELIAKMEEAADSAT